MSATYANEAVSQSCKTSLNLGLHFLNGGNGCSENVRSPMVSEVTLNTSQCGTSCVVKNEDLNSETFLDELELLICGDTSKSLVCSDSSKLLVQNVTSKEVVCNHCGKHLSCKSSYNRHMETYGGKCVAVVKAAGEFVCHHCGRNYNSKAGYRQHMNNYVGKCVPVVKASVYRKCLLCFTPLTGSDMSAVCYECTVPKACIYCGLITEGLPDEDFLQKIVRNSSANSKPCSKCVCKLMQYKLEDNSLMCTVCRNVVKTKKSLYSHITRIHILPKLVPKCEKCGMIYNKCSGTELVQMTIANTKEDTEPCKKCLKRAVRWTTDGGSPCCPLCKKKFSGNHVDEHIISMHMSSYLYKCELCGKKCKTKGNLRGHSKIHKEDRKEKCNSCDKFINKDYLDYHIQQFHSENPEMYVCSQCGKKLKGKNSFRDHMTKHENKIHTCDLCGKGFATRKHLLAHVKRFHERKGAVSVKLERLQCEICKKMIAGENGLKLHILLKHATRSEKMAGLKFWCKYCDRGFMSKEFMIDHENGHTGNRPYHCDFCGKSFARKMNFRRHEKIHTGEKKYKCDTCGLSFNQKCTLTRHQVVHTGEKPFECGICGQRFTQKPYMKAHEKKHKEGEVMEKKQKKKKNKADESSEESEEDMSEESEEDMSE